MGNLAGIAGGGPLVVPLARAATLAREAMGPKARNLARLREAGLPVPDGFVITAPAWRRFAAACGADRLLGEDLRRDRIEEVSRRGQSLCRERALPEQLVEAIGAGLERLDAPTVAVRSAALAEDQADASAAGIFHTALEVQGLERVLAALRDCWASAFSAAALAYRIDHPGQGDDRAMAVLVQSMVAPEAAGVLFTPRERNGSRQILVEAVFGHGQSLVDGSADPVRFSLPRSTAGVEAKRLLPSEAEAELVRLAREVEDLLQPGIDVEWAWDGDAVHILQARPVTRSAPSGGAGRVRWTAANTQEALLDPVTPLTWSLLSPLVEAGRRDLFVAAGFDEISGPGYMKLFFGLPYFNPDYFRAFLRQIPGVPDTIFDVLIFGEGEGIDFRLPEFTGKTVRMAGLLILARLFARERFELFSRVFGLRLRRLTRRSLRRVSDSDLVALRRRATVLLEQALRRHVLGTAISGGAYLLLELFLRHTGEDRSTSAGTASRLASGATGCALAEASQQLEQLARRAAVELEGDPCLLTKLEAELQAGGSGGSKLSRAFRRFLRDYGHRCEKEAELSEPRWADDPTALLEVLRSYVEAAKGHGDGLVHLREREESLTRRARDLADKISRRLTRRTWVERVLPYHRATFRYLLREARRYAPYRENLKDCGLRALHLIRQIFLEAGRRLAERGLIDAPHDVFYLDLAQVELALTGSRQPSLRERVAEARAERERFRGQLPPRHVIEVPGHPPRPVHLEGEVGRLLEGAGVSAGQLTGTARVLHGLEDAARLAPGEILVARVVNAGWTPLFHLAGAIVAEVGGVLSHGAIVAREYGLPAVFGAAGASRIPDGATITVDGDLGIVSVGETPPE